MKKLCEEVPASKKEQTGNIRHKLFYFNKKNFKDLSNALYNVIILLDFSIFGLYN